MVDGRSLSAYKNLESLRSIHTAPEVLWCIQSGSAD